MHAISDAMFKICSNIKYCVYIEKTVWYGAMNYGMDS